MLEDLAMMFYSIVFLFFLITKIWEQSSVARLLSIGNNRSCQSTLNKVGTLMISCKVSKLIYLLYFYTLSSWFHCNLISLTDRFLNILVLSCGIHWHRGAPNLNRSRNLNDLSFVTNLSLSSLSTVSCEQVIKMISSGYRLSPPPGCPHAIYIIMMACW